MAVKQTAYPEQGQEFQTSSSASTSHVDSAAHGMGGRVRAVIGGGVEVQRAVRREAEDTVGDAQLDVGVGVECRGCTKQIPPQYASPGACGQCRCTAVSIVRSTRDARPGHGRAPIERSRRPRYQYHSAAAM